MKSGPRSNNLALIAIVAEGFLSRLSFGMIGFALPLYAYHLGMKLTEIGILASINLVVAMALKPAMGVIADRVGLKPSFTAATALRSVVSLALAFVTSPWQLLTARSVYGISQSLRDPALNALLAEHGGQKRIAAAFGWYSTAKSVGGSLGSAFAGILLGLTASNYSLVFVVAFVLSLLPVVVVGRYVQETNVTSESADERLELVRAEPAIRDGGNRASAPASTRVILSYIGLGIMISGTAQMLRGLLPILATQYAGLSETETGVVYTVSTLVVMFSGPLFGWLSDNVSQKLVLMVRGIANTLSSILFVAFPNLAGITLGKVVDDVGKAAFKPAWGALMADVSRFEKQRRTQIISLMCLAEDAGEIGGPILASVLWSAWGVPVVLGVRILLALITEIYATVLVTSMNTRQRFECLPPMGTSIARGLRRRAGPLLLLALALVTPEIARADTPTLEIPRNPPPAVESLLKGPAETKGRLSDFRQRDPGDGIPVSRQTTAFVSYDDKNLYVLFVCEDEPEQVRSHMTRREAISSDDYVLVYLDTFRDGQRAYYFAVNPLGVQLDGIFTEGQKNDDSFDTIWDSEGRLTDSGYVVRMRIPFKSLRFSSTSEQRWGIALGRIIQRNNEESYWPYITKRVQGFVRQFATVSGLAQISPGRNLQVNPYVVGAGARFLDPSAMAFRNDREARVGMDAKAVVRDAITVDATVNPDFSQVESDDPQVTVNERFEVFFPEKRPFFTENAGYFKTPIDLFFSRRVVDPGVGVRLSGKMSRWAFGGLAINDRAPGRLPAEDARAGREAGIGVFRIQREFGHESYLGALTTNREFAGSFGRMFAIDGRWTFGPNWSVAGQLARSRTAKLDKSPVGGSAAVAQLRRNGRNFDLEGNYLDFDPSFSAPLGFVKRVGYRQTDQRVKYRWRPARGPVLRYGPQLSTLFNWRPDGRLQDREVAADFKVALRRNSEVAIKRTEAFELFRNYPFRPYATAASATTEWWKWLALSATYTWGTAVNHDPADRLVPFLGRATKADVTVTVRPMSRLRVEQTYIRSTLELLQASSRVFDDSLLRVKLNYQFNRPLSLRVILDHASLIADPTLAKLDHERKWTPDVLLTYLVHPGTALYLGYTDRHENLALVPGPVPVLGRTAQADTSVARQLFVKVGYLWRF